MSVFANTMSTLMRDPRIKQMKQFKHHRTTTTYQHSVRVAYTAYKIAQTLHLRIDEHDLAHGALLHDFYLYSTNSDNLNAYEHSHKHPFLALENAKLNFSISPLAEEIIRCHMWPINPTSIPRHKESVLVSIADKYIAIREFCNTI